MIREVTGEAAGVPYVLRRGERDDALVVVWHLGDPPRSAAAMSAAIPLAGLDATALYLTLPMLGARAPAAERPEIMRRAMEDPALAFFDPVRVQAAGELPAVLDELRTSHGLRPARIAIVGGSIGGGTALTALTELDLPFVAGSLLVPAVQLRALIDGAGPAFGIDYQWTAAADAAAARFDFVARAGELAARRIPIQCLLGANDAAYINAPAEALRAALVAAGATVDWQVIPGLTHALAEEPGEDAAPQTTHAQTVDAAVVRFLAPHLA